MCFKFMEQTKEKGEIRMKKYLAILGLLAVVSQPVFAQCATCNPCNTCLPRVQVAVPIVQQCALICNPCNPCMTGAACNICNPCNPCATGYAAPCYNQCYNPCACDPCNPCCPAKKGFWKRFFGY